MKREYDFSKAERGRFYRKGARLKLPIYLDSKLQDRIEKIAERKRQTVGVTVDRIIRKEVESLGRFL